MKIEFDLDVDEIVEEIKEEAIEKLKRELTLSCDFAFRDALSTVNVGSFRDSWGRCDDPVTRADIGAIVYKWVKEEFKSDVVEYILQQKDYKFRLDELKVDDNLAALTAYHLSRSAKFRKDVLSKIKCTNETSE